MLASLLCTSTCSCFKVSSRRTLSPLPSSWLPKPLFACGVKSTTPCKLGWAAGEGTPWKSDRVPEGGKAQEAGDCPMLPDLLFLQAASCPRLRPLQFLIPALVLTRRSYLWLSGHLETVSTEQGTEPRSGGWLSSGHTGGLGCRVEMGQ